MLRCCGRERLWMAHAERSAIEMDKYNTTQCIHYDNKDWFHSFIIVVVVVFDYCDDDEYDDYGDDDDDDDDDEGSNDENANDNDSDDDGDDDDECNRRDTWVCRPSKID